ncbi:MAG: TIGR00270 family protein [Candidatus Bathyarchaeota archaeon]|nr:MAG: TIGR00270 family protein [Candidatus Bathyarchaeota archaeon]
MVTCEVCGREIFGKPFKAMIGRAKLIVCRECAELGSVSWEVQSKRQRSVGKTARLPPQVSITKPSALPLSDDLELVEDFGLRIRASRREAELSHEDLGRKVGEKTSVLRKIEMGRMTPNHLLAQKLEHVLKVKLLVPPSEPAISRSHLSPPPEVTLGDVVRLKKGKAEEAERREQS